MYARYVLALVALLLVPAAFAQNATSDAQDHLRRNATRYGLTAADLTDLTVTDAYTSRRSGTTVVYVRQRLDGIDIADANATVALDRTQRVFHTAGADRFSADLASRRASASASLTAEAAAEALARYNGLTPTAPFQTVEARGGADRAVTLSDGGVALEPIPARLIWHRDNRGDLHLAWEVGLYQLDAQHYWLGRVDAGTGAVLAQTDLVVHDTFGHAEAEALDLPASFAPVETVPAPMAPYAGGATYRAYTYPVESPIYANPLPPADARGLQVNPEDATASPFGWHDTDGVAGAEYTVTRGNNVHAYTDLDANNSPDPGSDPDGGAALLFDFPLDLTQAPSAYRPAAVTNLFFWNNLFHDILYHYGFDEVSGNFQVNNYGRGGAGNDDVRAEAQDGSGTNNANFFTPSDGQRPRMQMYIGTNPNPDIDGDLDNGVIVHEYGHGVSNRLTGGPSAVGCLSNGEQMGEGWSDYYAIMMTIEPGDSGPDARGMGNYLFGQPTTGGGIRLSPYSTDFSVNNYTYGRTTSMGAVHQIGFVWATILWEVTWEMIDEYGFDADLYNANGTAGNQVMLNLVTEGMKYQPCSPGFVDGRDGILAADVALYGGAHTDVLWRAFARRGLGLGADQGSSSTTSDNVESFIEPEEIPPSPVTDLAAAPGSLGIDLTWTATGDDGTVGTAAVYDLRYASSPITNQAQFDAATPVDGEPTPQESGSAEAFSVLGLDFSTEYHFALKVLDESFNSSDLSNPASATTAAPPSAQISDTPIVVNVAPGATGTATLAIGNSGPSDLMYALDFTETTPAPRLRPTVEPGVATPPVLADPQLPKDARQPSGAEQLRGRGGPDAFGYSWIDSDETGGPTYAWVDISGTGTNVSLSDDGEVQLTLPFTFSFYDVDYTQATLGANGALSFTDTQIDYINDPIPNTSTPNALIAPFWDDLNPALGGTIKHQDMGDGRFIIQWTDVPHYPSSGSGEYTFQVILYESGQILFQYEDVDGSTLDSATIGIENAAGTDGLQVVNNASYAHNGLAVRISSIWVSATPSGGMVAQGSTENVELLFDASGLAEGTYTADMTVTTNEPGGSALVIPLTLNVTTQAPPAAVVTPMAHDLQVPRGESDTATMTVSNSGEADLVWSLAMQGGGELPEWLSFDAMNGVVSGGASMDVTLTAEPGDLPVGMYSALLTMGTNDPNNASMTIQVDMEAMAGVDTESGLEFPGTHLLGDVYPNPFNPQATFTLAVAQAQDVRVELFDALGRRVAQLHNGALAGRTSHGFTIDGSALTSGTYFVRIAGETFAESLRVTLLK